MTDMPIADKLNLSISITTSEHIEDDVVDLVRDEIYNHPSFMEDFDIEMRRRMEHVIQRVTLDG